MRIEKNFPSLDSLEQWTEVFAKSLSFKTVLMIRGPVGAGKTQWIKFLVKHLGGVEVSSPSYTILNTYPIKGGQFEHVDLYRVKDEHDLESTGFWDIFSHEQAIIGIEWSERLSRDLIPKNWKIYEVEFSVDNKDESRKVILRPI